jgi:hypothetical protein
METLTIEFLRPVLQVMVLVGVAATVAVCCLQCGAQQAILSAMGRRRSHGAQDWRARRTIEPIPRNVVPPRAPDEYEHSSHGLEEMALMKKPRAANSPIQRFL